MALDLSDQQVLAQYASQLEAVPRPEQRRARRRWLNMQRQADAMLDWHQTRADGRRQFLWSPLNLGVLFIMGGGALAALPRWLSHLSPFGIALRLGIDVVAAALLVGIQTEFIWRMSERNYVAWLARAREEATKALAAAPAPGDRSSSGLPSN